MIRARAAEPGVLARICRCEDLACSCIAGPIQDRCTATAASCLVNARDMWARMTHEQTETVWQTRAFQSSASPIRASAGADRSGAQGRSLLRPRHRQAGDGDIAICGDRIVGTYADYRGLQEIDISGRRTVGIVPGRIITRDLEFDLPVGEKRGASISPTTWSSAMTSRAGHSLSIPRRCGSTCPHASGRTPC